MEYRIRSFQRAGAIGIPSLITHFLRIHQKFTTPIISALRSINISPYQYPRPMFSSVSISMFPSMSPSMSLMLILPSPLIQVLEASQNSLRLSIILFISQPQRIRIHELLHTLPAHTLEIHIQIHVLGLNCGLLPRSAWYLRVVGAIGCSCV